MSSNAKHWDAKFREDLAHESDRAIAIVGAAQLEQALEALLRNHLVPCGTQDDPLFDGPYAPLANLSSKIDLAHRLGLISARWCRDLHLIRKIRNAFAHNVSGCTFDDSSVRSRVLELVRSQRAVEYDPDLRPAFPTGPKGDFGMTVSWMLWCLWEQAETVQELATAPDVVLSTGEAETAITPSSAGCAGNSASEEGAEGKGDATA
jgi:hypothetical protein